MQTDKEPPPKHPLRDLSLTNQVLNLSAKNLPPHAISALNKGLSFVPTPTKPPPYPIYKQQRNDTLRRLRLKDHFHQEPDASENPNPTTRQNKNLPIPSTYDPKKAVTQEMDNYITHVADIYDYLPTKPEPSSPSYTEPQTKYFLLADHNASFLLDLPHTKTLFIPRLTLQSAKDNIALLTPTLLHERVTLILWFNQLEVITNDQPWTLTASNLYDILIKSETLSHKVAICHVPPVATIDASHLPKPPPSTIENYRIKKFNQNITTAILGHPHAQAITFPKLWDSTLQYPHPHMVNRFSGTLNDQATKYTRDTIAMNIGLNL